MKNKSIIVIFFLFFPFLSWSKSYKRGELTCSDFEQVQVSYENQPENIVTQQIYAACLLAKREDAEALNRLRALVRDHRQVFPSFLIARYLQTEGEFSSGITDIYLAQAIQAYDETISLINSDSDYPRGYEEHERDQHMELHSHYYVSALSFVKYYLGVIGQHNQAQLNSSGYTGDRNLKTYEEYSGTRESLRETIAYASRCADLPLKEHFHAERYLAVKNTCRMYVEKAEELLAMEDQRQNILLACPNISFCSAYDNIYAEIMQVREDARSVVRSEFKKLQN